MSKHLLYSQEWFKTRLFWDRFLLPLDFRFFNHRDFHCFFVILLSTFCIFHRGDFISESFCTQNVLITFLIFRYNNDLIVLIKNNSFILVGIYNYISFSATIVPITKVNLTLTSCTFTKYV